jgi:hypothetical protein
MATAKQIKSAIRSQSSAQRGVTQQLAGVESLLQQADFSSKMSDIKNKQRETMFATAASGLELASTFGEGLKQKAELESNIKAFEESLPEAVRKAGGVSVIENPNKASFIDVLKGEGSLSSFLYDEKEQYMLGENVLGSKYDVAAMGEKAKALEQTDLLDRFMQGEPLDSKSPTLESSLQLDSGGMPTLTKDFSSIYGKEIDIESLQDSVDKPLIKEDTTIKTSDAEIIVDSEGGPLKFNEDNAQNSLTYFSKDLNYLNPDNIMTEDSASAYEVATESGSNKFVEDIPESEKSISSKVSKTPVKDFGTVSKRFSTPERALGEIDKQMKEISKLRDESRYANKTSYNNALKKADKLEKELKKNISSVYNSKTGKFRSEEYKQMFEKGKYLKGDPRGVGEKEGFANISRRVDFAGMQTPFQTAQEVNLTNVQNFINQLFPKDLASR